MEQQFDHLTNAQLEHYGKEQAGAGPDQNQKLEAHLADCSGCRRRLLAFHRTRFTPDSRPGSTPSMMHHSSLTAARLPDCPAEEDLRNLAAGLTPPDQAVPLIQHAAQCARCGPVLSMYTEDFSDDLSPDDEALIAQLKSASPEWQKRLVRDLQVANSDADAKPGASPAALRSRSTGKRPWLRWALVPATVAACAAVAFVVWSQQRDTPEKAEELLAQAYTEPRTIEMRWPGAAGTPMRVTRGAPDSTFWQSPTLLDAETAIAHHLQKDPSNPEWLLAKAQADILERDPIAAIAALNQAQHSNSNSAAALYLAIAYSLQGDITSDPQQYGHALELLNNIVNRQPRNRVALFNRALIYERMQMNTESSKDWKRLLQLETDAGWKTEEEQHLKNLEEKKTHGR